MDVSNTPISIRVLQSIAISSAAVAAGSNIGTSVACIPSLLDSPAPLLAKQWKQLYDNGFALVVPCAMGSAATFAFLSYDAAVRTAAASASASAFAGSGSGSGGLQVRLYACAAVAAAGLAGFTRAFMWGNIEMLKSEAARVEGGNGTAVGGKENSRGGDVHDLVREWSRLNLIRGFLPLLATVIGVWGVSEGL